ncbi:MAG: RNA polymerase sigma factor [Bacteroidia bacterium]|nr:RNA polymerase sigma factor [Bacteroidia bacterium]
MKCPDDTYCITRVLQGNTNAYSYLVEKYKRMAYTLALKLVQVPEDAEEIAQDAFVKAFQALGTFKGESKFSTWLYKIIYNVSIARLRKKQLEVISIDDDQNSDFDICETDDFLTQLAIEEQNAIVRSCIDQLSAGERALITLYYMNESTVKEITHITGDTESNVKIKLFRIRNKLRGMIKYNLRDKITVDYEE